MAACTLPRVNVPPPPLECSISAPLPRPRADSNSDSLPQPAISSDAVPLSGTDAGIPVAGSAGRFVGPKPPRTRPQMSPEDARKTFMQCLSVCGDDDGRRAFTLDLPGGIYAGHQVIDEAWWESMQLDTGDMDRFYVDQAATEVHLIKITDRPFTSSSLERLVAWMDRPGRNPRNLVLTETWLQDEDVKNTLIPFLRKTPPEFIGLDCNSLTGMMCTRLLKGIASSGARVRIDVANNYIPDPVAFKDRTLTSFTDDGLPSDEVKFFYCCDNLPPVGRMAVNYGPVWSLAEGTRNLNSKQQWYKYMAGPSQKLSQRLDQMRWKRWICAVCGTTCDENAKLCDGEGDRKIDENTKTCDENAGRRIDGDRKIDENTKICDEDAGRRICRNVTFGAILASHFRGQHHRKRLLWKKHEVLDFDGYFFHPVSGRQGETREEVEAEPLDPVPQFECASGPKWLPPPVCTRHVPQFHAPHPCCEPSMAAAPKPTGPCPFKPALRVPLGYSSGPPSVASSSAGDSPQVPIFNRQEAPFRCPSPVSSASSTIWPQGYTHSVASSPAARTPRMPAFLPRQELRGGDYAAGPPSAAPASNLGCKDYAAGPPSAAAGASSSSAARAPRMPIFSRQENPWVPPPIPATIPPFSEPHREDPWVPPPIPETIPPFSEPNRENPRVPLPIPETVPPFSEPHRENTWVPPPIPETVPQFSEPHRDRVTLRRNFDQPPPPLRSGIMLPPPPPPPDTRPPPPTDLDDGEGPPPPPPE